MSIKVFSLSAMFILAFFFAGCASDTEDYYSKSEVDSRISASNGVIGWGVVNSAGTTVSGSGNFTSARTAAGSYTVTWSGTTTSLSTESVFIPSPTSSGDFHMTASCFGGSTVTVNNYNGSGTLTDIGFSFFAYKK